MTPVEVVQGDSPVVLGLPHTGTDVPPEVRTRLTPLGQSLADTDWHIHRLYDGLLPGVTTVRATFHRYVIDANRDPSGASLYPGQNTTGLIPQTDFDGEPLWHDPPDAAETAGRLARYHTPYHAALAAELERVRERHGVVVLYDCHSIRSRIPFLFDGLLPDFNIGTNHGVTCDPRVAETVQGLCAKASGLTHIVNGRFTGGWTTRHYGRPAEGLHAIQMELAQSAYLSAEAPPWSYDAAKAATLRGTLGPILHALAALAPELR